MKQVNTKEGRQKSSPTREEAIQAVKTLVAWAGDDPGREGLKDTPSRVVNAYKELFGGYDMSPDEVLSHTFTWDKEYDEIIIVKNVRVESYCEHHMLPITGKAHVAYIPDKRIVGISKLARLVDVFAKRLQIQEKMTNQIADAIWRALKPKGVAVVMDLAHQCMTIRGVHKTETSVVTNSMLGLFRDDQRTKAEFMSLISGC